MIKNDTSLDQVLECISVSPLLRVGGSVSDGGEVAEAEAILHALLTTRLLLLGALQERQTQAHSYNNRSVVEASQLRLDAVLNSS